MKKEDIIQLTKQAGGFAPTPEFLECFAKLVAAAEREACAKLCEESDRYRGDYFASKICAMGQQ